MAYGRGEGSVGDGETSERRSPTTTSIKLRLMPQGIECVDLRRKAAKMVEEKKLALRHQREKDFDEWRSKVSWMQPG